MIRQQGCQNRVSKKVWKLREVFNVRVTAGQLGGGAFPVFVWGPRIFLQKRVKILEL